MGWNFILAILLAINVDISCQERIRNQRYFSTYGQEYIKIGLFVVPISWI